jgi:hypothetical protein
VNLLKFQYLDKSEIKIKVEENSEKYFEGLMLNDKTIPLTLTCPTEIKNFNVDRQSKLITCSLIQKHASFPKRVICLNDFP